MSQWHPIETAPRDGKPFLAYDGRAVAEVYWAKPWAEFVYTLSGGTYGTRPTHWMPLPEAPKEPA